MVVFFACFSSLSFQRQDVRGSMYEQIQFLQRLGKHQQAEELIRKELGENPDDATTHALLAISLMEQERKQDAVDEAALAIHLQPDDDFPYYVMAMLQFQLNDHKAAYENIANAIEIDPSDPNLFALQANIYAADQKWRKALASANEGLEWVPDHEGCNNFRAMALMKLGREEEAGEGLEAILQENPDDSFTHANTGWTLLQTGNHKKAAEHFREALRLEPNNEWAREGVITSLKSKNPIYRLMLKWVFWMSKFDEGRKQTIIFGMWIAVIFSERIEQALPFLSPVMPWLLGGYLIFALSTWLTEPFFDMTLALSREGRQILSGKSKRISLLFAPLFFIALGLAFAFMATEERIFFTSAFMLVGHLFGLCGLLQARSKADHLYVGAFIVLFAIITGGHVWLMSQGSLWANAWYRCFFVLFIAYQILIITTKTVGYFQTRAYTIRRYALLTCALGAAISLGWLKERPLPRQPLSISIETSYLTKPLDENGAVDYIGFLQQTYSPNVDHPDNLFHCLKDLSPEAENSTWIPFATIDAPLSLEEVHAALASTNASDTNKAAEIDLSPYEDWARSNLVTLNKFSGWAALPFYEIEWTESTDPTSVFSKRLHSINLDYFFESAIALRMLSQAEDFPAEEQATRLQDLLTLSQHVIDSPDLNQVGIGLKVYDITLLHLSKLVSQNHEHPALKILYDVSIPEFPLQQLNHHVRLMSLASLQYQATIDRLPAWHWQSGIPEQTVTIFGLHTDRLAREINLRADRMAEVFSQSDMEDAQQAIDKMMNEIPSGPWSIRGWFRTAKEKQVITSSVASLKYAQRYLLTASSLASRFADNETYYESILALQQTLSNPPEATVESPE